MTRISSALFAKAPANPGPQVRSRIRLIRRNLSILAALLIIGTGFTYWTSLEVTFANRKAILHATRSNSLQAVLLTIKDAETGQRGYLLTGDSQYLAPYRAALGRLDRELENGEYELRAQPSEAAQLRALKGLIADKLSELEQTIRVRTEQGLEAAISIVQTDRGRAQMDRIRALLDPMIEQEEESAEAFRQIAVRAANDRAFIFALVISINLAFLIWASRRISRAVNLEAVAQIEVRQQQELLAVTLESIGDGVIVTDAVGRVAFLNQTAEKLTGWTLSESIGRPCSTIFRIIDEDSRQNVEGPTEKVLRLGQVVAPANHTRLIRQDGCELIIDDNGAPIRDASGKVRGVILVFRDSTKHKNAEIEIRRLNSELREKVAELEAIFRVAPVGLAVSADSRGASLRTNPYFAQLLKLPIQAHTSMTAPGDPRPSHYRVYRRGHLLSPDQLPIPLAAATGTVVEDCELDLVFDDGSSVILFGGAAPLFDPQGHPRGSVGAFADITARRRADAQLQRLANVVENSTDFIAIFDPAGSPIFVNQAGMALIGADGFPAIRNTTVADYFIPEERNFVREVVLPTVLDRGHWSGELHVRHWRREQTIPVISDLFRIDDPNTGEPMNFGIVSRDITARKRTEAELLAAKERAEAANLAKDEFLATLSHELRTPLSPLLVTLALWESQVPVHLLPDLQMMRRNLELEARLIDDLLDLTRIAKGKLSLHLECADLHVLLQAVAGFCQSEIASRGIQFVLELGAARHHVQGDPARLQQTFLNLLNNAIKFVPENGQIAVRTENDSEGNLTVIVADNGIGMSQETIDRLFRPFEQGPWETVRRFGGLGLGLAISRTLLEAQRGKIRAESAGLGQGSSFIVTLPALAAPESAEPAAPEHPLPTKRINPPPLRILLVEDHKDTAHAMSRLLQRRGHQVHAATSIHEALTAAEQPFDLLLSDIGLPDGSGVELIGRLRERLGANFPAIALTGFGMDHDIAESHRAGFNEHLTKPVKIQQLDHLLERFSPKS